MECKRLSKNLTGELGEGKRGSLGDKRFQGGKLSGKFPEGKLASNKFGKGKL